LVHILILEPEEKSAIGVGLNNRGGAAESECFWWTATCTVKWSLCYVYGRYNFQQLSQLITGFGLAILTYSKMSLIAEYHT